MSWRRVRLDWVTTEARNTVDPSDFGEQLVDHFSIPDLDATGGPAIQPASELESNKQRLWGGEVLISRLNPRKARVLYLEGISERPALCSGEFIVLQPVAVDPRFLRYLLLSETTRQFLHGAVQSVTRSHQRIRPEIITKIWLDLPLDPEQRAIADYLDRETARIDALIDKKQRIAALLKERCSACIASAVSGSLAGMKNAEPCDLGWMESMPSHWSTPKITHVARLGTGHTPSRSHPEWWIGDECVIPWITTGEVAALRTDRIEYITETRERISEVGIANSSAEVHPAGTVVLCRTASVGYSGIMPTAMATSQDFATWSCGERLNPRFLLLCLRAMRPDLLGRLAMGSTHQTIYMPDIQSLRIPLPPIDEQELLVGLAWSVIDKLLSAADCLLEQVDLLRERRKALITGAVTSELEVAA